MRFAQVIRNIAVTVILTVGIVVASHPTGAYAAGCNNCSGPNCGSGDSWCCCGFGEHCFACPGVCCCTTSIFNCCK